MEKRIAAEGLNKLQELQLSIFREFIRVCEELSLRYFLVEGTMLGAVRHSGFIPWDDDIDIGMPRPDYDRFLREAPALLDERYYLSTHRNNTEHYWMTAILFDRETKVVLRNAADEVISYAWIDIIPIEGMPEGKIRQRLHYIRYRFYRTLYQVSHLSKIVNVNKRRPFIERIAIRTLIKIGVENRLDSIFVGDKLHNVLSWCEYDSSDYVMQVISEYKMRELMPRSVFGEGSKYIFEGIEVRGVAEAPTYLGQLYGDYMQLPPENERRGKHNASIIDGEG